MYAIRINFLFYNRHITTVNFILNEKWCGKIGIIYDIGKEQNEIYSFANRKKYINYDCAIIKHIISVQHIYIQLFYALEKIQITTITLILINCFKIHYNCMWFNLS